MRENSTAPTSCIIDPDNITKDGGIWYFPIRAAAKVDDKGTKAPNDSNRTAASKDESPFTVIYRCGI
jgi:CO dehydrogenase/acetyl-CoA synthase beta subunit